LLTKNKKLVTITAWFLNLLAGSIFHVQVINMSLVSHFLVPL